MIRIRGLKKEFPTKEGVVGALRELDLDVQDKEFFVLLGPSGSGKSTLLRCVAGIETPTGGELYINDQLMYSKDKRVSVLPEDRGLGMVFQSYAVWPHLTVFQNVALPLTHGRRKIPRSQVKDRVMHALSLVQMEKLADRPVPYLSGGQQQRVALARGLAVEPLVLLMDEPLCNLDARLREEVRAQIRDVTKKIGVTVLYVTHDQTEAMALADRVAVMDQGSILQLDSPNEIYRRPVAPIVAEFFGQVNWLSGAAVGGGRIDTPIGTLLTDNHAVSGPVRVGVRPSDLFVAMTRDENANEFPGLVTEQISLGDHMVLKVRLASETDVQIKVPSGMHAQWLGRQVFCRYSPSELLVFSDRNQPVNTLNKVRAAS
ncbi:MAG TPA: ABC transporter ATP-binding protein [Alphaproteobacteria bacterium]|jgi:iron(III) transport system ATP-binding protein